MGKKRVTYHLNDEDKPPNPDTLDHHHHHHHHHRHRHDNHQKPKKIKPEARLLHTLNSHFKKLAKCRSRKVISLSSHRANDSREDNKRRDGHLSSSLNLDNNSNNNNNNNKDDRNDWFMGTDFDYDDFGGYMGEFGFGQEICLKTMSFLGSESNEDLFGGDGVFGPDLSASPSMVVVFEEDGYGYGSYIPDPVMKLDDNGDEGKYLYDMLELSSPEDMINEFLKVNLLV